MEGCSWRLFPRSPRTYVALVKVTTKDFCGQHVNICIFSSVVHAEIPVITQRGWNWIVVSGEIDVSACSAPTAAVVV